jgi:hypothetical protein
MSARYLRCDGCGKDLPNGPSDFKDGYALNRYALEQGWSIYSEYWDSFYTKKHYCKECTSARQRC